MQKQARHPTPTPPPMPRSRLARRAIPSTSSPSSSSSSSPPSDESAWAARRRLLRKPRSSTCTVGWRAKRRTMHAGLQQVIKARPDCTAALSSLPQSLQVAAVWLTQLTLLLALYCPGTPTSRNLRGEVLDQKQREGVRPTPLCKCATGSAISHPAVQHVPHVPFLFLMQPTCRPGVPPGWAPCPRG